MSFPGSTGPGVARRVGLCSPRWGCGEWGVAEGPDPCRASRAAGASV